MAHVHIADQRSNTGPQGYRNLCVVLFPCKVNAQTGKTCRTQLTEAVNSNGNLLVNIGVVLFCFAILFHWSLLAPFPLVKQKCFCCIPVFFFVDMEELSKFFKNYFCETIDTQTIGIEQDAKRQLRHVKEPRTKNVCTARTQNSTWRDSFSWTEIWWARNCRKGEGIFQQKSFLVQPQGKQVEEKVRWMCPFSFSEIVSQR